MAADDVADGEGEALLLGEELPTDADGTAGDEEDFTAFLDEEADLGGVRDEQKRYGLKLKKGAWRAGSKGKRVACRNRSRQGRTMTYILFHSCHATSSTA